MAAPVPSGVSDLQLPPAAASQPSAGKRAKTATTAAAAPPPPPPAPSSAAAAAASYAWSPTLGGVDKRAVLRDALVEASRNREVQRTVAEFSSLLGFAA